MLVNFFLTYTTFFIISGYAVASLLSLPSPPFRLCRRRKGAAGYIPPEDASPRRYHNTATNHSATTSLLSRCRRPPQSLPLPQPVCYHAADDHRNPYLYHNQSAITLRTTTVTPTFTITSLQLSSCGRPPQPLPLPQPVCSYRAADDHRNPYLYRNQFAAIALQTTTTTTFTAYYRCN